VCKVPEDCITLWANEVQLPLWDTVEGAGYFSAHRAVRYDADCAAAS
jgi:hypothetical protein